MKKIPQKDIEECDQMPTNETKSEDRIVPVASAAAAVFKCIIHKNGALHRLFITTVVMIIFLFDPVMEGSALNNPALFLNPDTHRAPPAPESVATYYAIDNKAFEDLSINDKDMSFIKEISFAADPPPEKPIDDTEEKIVQSSSIVEEIKAVEENDAKDNAPSPPYYHIILKVADRYDLDPALIRAMIMVESSNNPNAISKRGAKGLMQLMPGTAEELGVEDLFDPEHNVDGGARYLQRMMVRFKGDIKLALAAYNAGSRHVLNYGGVPPFKETQRYVKKVLARYESYKIGM